jgi:thioredoxin 1
MENNGEQKKEVSDSGCGFGSCCTGPGRWLRAVLVVAVFGVVIALNVWRKDKPAAAPAAGSAAGTVGTQDLQPAGQGQALPRLVDLGATTCIPCKMMKPILDDFKANYADAFTTEFIDVWKNPDAGKKYRINVIPTQIFFDAAGKELFRHEGFYGKEDMLKKWQEFGVDLSAKTETPK